MISQERDDAIANLRSVLARKPLREDSHSPQFFLFGKLSKLRIETLHQWSPVPLISRGHESRSSKQSPRMGYCKMCRFGGQGSVYAVEVCLTQCIAHAVIVPCAGSAEN